MTVQVLTVDGRLCCHLGWRPVSQGSDEFKSRWTEADSPWQLLAVCMDIAAAQRSGDPATYCSRLPVHQDGSCNGLQHYAALGRDAWGGSAVNLTPNEGHQVSSWGRHKRPDQQHMDLHTVALCCSIGCSPNTLTPSHGLRQSRQTLGTCFWPSMRRDSFARHLQLPMCMAQDVYTEVAALVREKVAADAVAGHPWAPLLHDAIDRKLVRARRHRMHEAS